METSLQIFEYEGSKITFEKDGSIMVNATEMAKPFGKRPIDWLENQSSIEFLNELSKVRKSTLADLVKVAKGGNNPGTWMHEDVAMEFARWLNPGFAIWCNDRIKELLTTGKAQLDTLTHPSKKQLAQWVIELEEQKERLQLTTQLQSKELEKAAPKVNYYDEVLQAQNTHTTTTIAKELGMSAKALNKKLHELGVIYLHEGHWVLYAKYQNYGYTKTRTHKYETVENEQIVSKTSITTVWTEKGREFIINLLRQDKAA